MKAAILGAGPCGLGAAHRLQAGGHLDWHLFEAATHVGGLSASFADDAGFTWDIGGHVLFSHYDYFDKAVEAALQGEYHEHLRESWVRILERWVPYPFQNNIRYLPDDVLEECVQGLRDIQGKRPDSANFHQWMKGVFGKGIVRYFMEPYNRKVWGVPLDTMSSAWIGERVSVVDLQRVEKNIREEKDDVNWGPNNRFKFPKRGGTGAIFEGIAHPLRDRIALDHKVVGVDLAAKEVRFSNGRRERYDFLINTSPLDAFVAMCDDVPSSVASAAEDLVHNGGLVVGAGFKGCRSDSRCWMYFPESTSPFYRVTNFHNYSPNNVPGGDTGSFFSLMCETTYSSWKPVDKERIVDETLAGLEASGMLMPGEREQLASAWTIDIPYSYPVPTTGRDRALSIIQPFLEYHGVFSRGRFGAWKYEVGNMDHSFMQGVEAVESILLGREERTVHGLCG